jgi:hypothetical protein
MGRRRFIAGISTLPLLSLMPPGWLESAAAGGWRFFTDHEADVVREATARLIPGPADDPREIGHPGARDARVVNYIDTLLGVFSFDPPHVFAGGPFSARAGAATDDMALFVALTPIQQVVWRERVTGLQQTYRRGIALLDSLAGGDFARVSADRQDQILGSRAAAVFCGVLFAHAIEGMYAAPEYGGNHDVIGWRDISFPGDSQPTGYTDAEVSERDEGDSAPAGPRLITAETFAAILPLLARRARRGE